METSTSMGRGMAVLDALGRLTAVPPHRASVAEIASELDRDRSQVSRTLSFLAAEGYALRGPDRGYQLSWDSYAAAQDLTERRLRTDGLTAIEGLSAVTGEACFLGELAGDSTVTIAESVPPATRLIGSWVGRPYPAYCSDAGQATLWDASDTEVREVFARTVFDSPGPNAARDVEEFLTRLRQARARGFSIVDEEAEPGLFSVAAPVSDFRGETIAAVQVVGTRARLAPRVNELGEACSAVAEALSRALGAPERS